MPQDRIGLNLVTLRNGQDAAALLPNLDRVRAAGFQGVGLWVSTIRQWLTGGKTLAGLVQEVHSRGLEIHEVCFVPVLDEQGNVADQGEVFAWARELEAPAVISIYGQPDQPLEKVRRDWARFVGKVADTGVAAAFEFIGPWKQYNSPLSAWEVVRAGPESGTIVCDTFHFWRGGGDLTQLDKVPGGRISLVHFNDVRDVPREKAQDSDRTYPGEGVMPLRRMVAALRRNGFAGPFSVEIFGPVQQDDPDQVSARAYRSARDVLEQA
jgi:2-keto-myo-inositol isomerase